MNESAPKLEDIFLAVLELGSIEERQQYLDEVCGDDAPLRQQVEELLRSHKSAGSFMQDEADPETTHLLSGVSESIGTVIGPYKLIEQIGEGGMGVVFRAAQSEPVKREVALKVIKPGMDSKEVISRFEAERQALAMMDHPHIAKVLDAGTTESGRPYFVMEMVKGWPITKFCDREQLSLTERLNLFRKVCEAVQHAHQKGIIHRDIKPSNVLVSLANGKPSVKVIDFGVAKALHHKLTDNTLWTSLQQVVGTPMYMSPEQADQAGAGYDIDTRTDIYSLGVLLYELLTGSTPFNREELQKAGIDEIRRIIREQEPAKPSTKISTLGETLPSVAAVRKLEPKRLSAFMRGDLDWIVMKALEKDRERRYATADALADDLERYLEHEPVEAGPPSKVYRFRKFARRNKGTLVAGVLIALSLVGGIVGTTWMAIEADRERDRAVEAEKRAELEVAITNEIGNFLMNDLLGQANPDNEPDRDIKLRTVLDRASSKIEESFNNRPVVERAIRMTLGTTYSQLGEWEIAEEHYRRAVELCSELYDQKHIETLRAQSSLGGVLDKQGKYEEAEGILLAVHDEAKNALDPTNPVYRQILITLGTHFNDVGKFKMSISFCQEALDITNQQPQESTSFEQEYATISAKNNLGIALTNNSQHRLAEKTLRELLPQVSKSLGSDHPFNSLVRGNLAIALQGQERYEEAEQLYREVMQIDRKILGEDHIVYLRNMLNLAGTLNKLDRYDEAQQLARKAIAGLKEKVGESHYYTLAAMNNLANSLSMQGQNQEAETLYRQAFNLSGQSLGADHPRTLIAMHNLAEQLLFIQRYEEAESLMREVTTRREKSLGPEKTETLDSRGVLAVILSYLENYPEAEQLFEISVRGLTDELGEMHHTTQWHLRNYVWFCENRTWHFSTTPDPQERDPARALIYARKALELQDNPNHWNNLGVALYRNGEFEEAVEALQTADEMLKGKDRQHRPFLAMSLWQLDRKEKSLQYARQYIAWYLSKKQGSEAQRFLAEMEELLGLSPDDHQQTVLGYYESVLEEDPDNQEALKARIGLFGELKSWEQQIVDLKRLLELTPEDASRWNQLAWAYQQLQQYHEALKAADRGIAANPEYPAIYMRRASALFSLEDYEGALASASQVVELDPARLEPYPTRAQTFIRLKQWSDALRDYEHFNQHGNASQYTFLYEALLHLKVGDLPGYQQACQQMLEKYREQPSAKYAEYLLETCGYAEQPSELLSQLIEIGEQQLIQNPKNANLARSVGILFIRRGDVDRAAELFAMARELGDGSHAVQIWTAIAAQQSGQTSVAQEWFSRIPERFPSGSLDWQVRRAELQLPLYRQEAAALIPLPLKAPKPELVTTD